MSFTFLSTVHTFGVGHWFHFSPVEEPGTLKWELLKLINLFLKTPWHRRTSCPGYELPPLRILRTLIFCKILNRGCLINNCEGALHLTKLQLYCLYIRKVSLHKGSSDDFMIFYFLHTSLTHPLLDHFIASTVIRTWYMQKRKENLSSLNIVFALTWNSAIVLTLV